MYLESEFCILINQFTMVIYTHLKVKAFCSCIHLTESYATETSEFKKKKSFTQHY